LRTAEKCKDIEGSLLKKKKKLKDATPKKEYGVGRRGKQKKKEFGDQKIKSSEGRMLRWVGRLRSPGKRRKNNRGEEKELGIKE